MNRTEYRHSHANLLREVWANARSQGRLPAGSGPEPTLNWLDLLIISSLLEEFEPTIGSDGNTEAVISAGLVEWERLGSPVFQLTESAAAAFVLTDVNNLCWRDINLPFSTFVIYMPSPSPIMFTSIDKQDVQIQAIHVSCMMAPSIPDEEFQKTCAELNDCLINRRPFREVLEKFKFKPTLWVSGHCDNLERDVIHRTYQFPSDENETIQEWVERTQAIPNQWVSEKSKHAMSLVCTVVAAMCVWLNNSDVPRYKPEELVKNKAAGKGTTWVVGREIKLSKELRDAARDQGRADRVPGVWELKSRLLVRGHMRNQPFGKGRAERRKQWIEPYWKGPEAGEVLPRMYKVET